MSGIIFGQELTKFDLVITDPWMAYIPGTVRWSIEDYLLDGTDNTATFSGLSLTDSVYHSFQSKGFKLVASEFEFVDGWGNINVYREELIVEAIPYYVPEFDWTYNPDPFRINQVFTVKSVYGDERPNGLIRFVSYNMDADNKSEFDHIEILKDESFNHSYPVKKTYKVLSRVNYWDGWEYQDHEFYDLPRVANSPPNADYSLYETGICVTKLELTDIATDPDGVDDITDRYFQLYKETDVPDTFSLIHDENITYTGGKYSYQFALEGRYKVIYTVTDSELAQDIKETIYDIVFRECGAGVSTPTEGSMSGTITIQPGWQLITIPTVKGYFDYNQGKIIKDKSVNSTVKNYLIDQLAYRLNVPIESMKDYIQVAIAYRGGVLSQNFVVGVTPETSVNNFNLAYVDEENNKKEFTAFWVKNISGVSLPEISWEYVSGE